MPTGVYIRTEEHKQNWFKKGHSSLASKESYINRGKNISLALLGRKLSEESRLKMRLTKLGKKQSPELIAKRIKSGIFHPRWKGGSREFYSSAARAIYYENNLIVICSICGSDKNIHIHHRDLDWKNNRINNLNPLCISCHTKFHEKLRQSKAIKQDKATEAPSFII